MGRKRKYRVKCEHCNGKGVILVDKWVTAKWLRRVRSVATLTQPKPHSKARIEKAMQSIKLPKGINTEVSLTPLR